MIKLRFTFSAMTRIFKTYQFDFGDKLTRGKSISFSSYPATISSSDDFYVTDSGLAVIETSNNIFNTSLYDYVRPTSLLCWQRVMLANRIAKNAPEWSTVFGKHNSGTYNNQYMCLDMKLFKPKQSLPKDLFWVVEQTPLFVKGEDQTKMLARGYWPSYNVPFYKEVFDISGYPEQIKKNPELKHMLNYETCARANIFRQRQSTVDGPKTMGELLRYNNYKNDPLSLDNPGYAIASRFDLQSASSPQDRFCGGGYDSKFTSIMQRNKVTIVNGPTRNEQNGIAPFSFGSQCSDKFQTHGLPTEWTFDWMDVSINE
jgi:hypothetical protein